MVKLNLKVKIFGTRYVILTCLVDINMIMYYYNSPHRLG